LVLDRAASEGAVLVAYHLDGIGRVRRHGDGYLFAGVHEQ
jgi:hypothetical protein